jgi:hypothetical protein
MDPTTPEYRQWMEWSDRWNNPDVDPEVFHWWEWRTFLNDKESVAQRLYPNIAGDIHFQNSIVCLTPEIASRLSSCDGRLYLNGLDSITPDCAALLARQQGYLSLDGIKVLDAESASELANHSGVISLEGIKTVDLHIAASLARHPGHVFLGCVALTIGDDEDIEIENGFGHLHLNSISSLSVQTTRFLCRHSGHLYLDGIRSLDMESAALLKNFRGIAISLSGLETLDPGVARCIADYDFKIFLLGIKQLSSEAIEALSFAKLLVSSRTFASLVGDGGG